MSTPALLEVRDVSVAYPIWGGIFRRRYVGACCCDKRTYVSPRLPLFGSRRISSSIDKGIDGQRQAPEGRQRG